MFTWTVHTVQFIMNLIPDLVNTEKASIKLYYSDRRKKQDPPRMSLTRQLCSLVPLIARLSTGPLKQPAISCRSSIS